MYGFTSENLKEYDLLIIDTDSYTGLGRASKEAMEEVAESQGLGVFVQAGEGLFRLSKSQSPFQFNRDYVTEIVLGQPAQTLSKYPYEFKETLRSQEILMDSVAVAAYLPIQKGKIGTTLLQNTYQLILDGKEALYAQIWTQILNNIAKEQESMLKWTAITQIPRRDEPFQFEVQTPLTDFQVQVNDDEIIPLLEDVLVPNKFTGVVYPKKTGWNQLRVFSDSILPLSYFVYEDEELQSIGQSEIMKVNYRKFGSKNTFDDSASILNKELEPVSPFWFYILLLFSLGWIWLEPKLSY